MIFQNIFRVGSFLYKGTKAGIIAMVMAVMLLGGTHVGEAANIDNGRLYIKAGDVVIYIPIEKLKDKASPQIVDIISRAVESAINNRDGLTPDQIEQAVVVARSAAHADVIALRVQAIYAQARSTNLDLETLVILDNVFASDELAINKSANIAGSGVTRPVQDKKLFVVDVN